MTTTRKYDLILSSADDTQVRKNQYNTASALCAQIETWMKQHVGLTGLDVIDNDDKIQDFYVLVLTEFENHASLTFSTGDEPPIEVEIHFKD